MKRRTTKPPTLSVASPTAPATQGRISFRLDPTINMRFEEVVKASRRSKTSLIEEAVEERLPQFEKKYLQAA